MTLSLKHNRFFVLYRRMLIVVWNSPTASVAFIRVKRWVEWMDRVYPRMRYLSGLAMVRLDQLITDLDRNKRYSGGGKWPNANCPSGSSQSPATSSTGYLGAEPPDKSVKPLLTPTATRRSPKRTGRRS